MKELNPLREEHISVYEEKIRMCKLKVSEGIYVEENLSLIKEYQELIEMLKGD